MNNAVSIVNTNKLLVCGPRVSHGVFVEWFLCKRCSRVKKTDFPMVLIVDGSSEIGAKRFYILLYISIQYVQEVLDHFIWYLQYKMGQVFLDCILYSISLYENHLVEEPCLSATEYRTDTQGTNTIHIFSYQIQT